MNLQGLMDLIVELEFASFELALSDISSRKEWRENLKACEKDILDFVEENFQAK